MRPKERSAFRQLLSLPQPLTIFYPIKSYYVFGTKIFLWRYAEISRHLLSMCFKNAVLGVKKWSSANVFLTPNQNMFAEKFVKSSELRFVKWVIFFASFCWLWNFLLENLKIKKKFWQCPLERVVVNPK